MARSEIGELWFQVNRLMHERFRQTFRELDLPPMSLVLTRQIHKEAGLTVSELARRLETAKSHVSTMVDHLVGKGYLERQADPADQRLLRVTLTPEGAQVVAVMKARVDETWAAALTDLTDADRQRVTEALRTLHSTLQQNREGDGGGCCD